MLVRHRLMHLPLALPTIDYDEWIPSGHASPKAE